MPWCDLHTHTVFSHDARQLPDQLGLDALQKDLFGIAVTDHYDFYADKSGSSYYESFRDRRPGAVRRMQSLYGGGATRIWYGIELGQPHHNVKAALRVLEQEDFDVVIGSLHSMPGFTHFLRTDYGSREGCMTFFGHYFREMLAMVENFEFDILGHLDYPVRVMGKYMQDDPELRACRDMILPVLEACVRKDVALEVNTAGLRRWLTTPGPARWVLEEYRAIGGDKVTMGSDAHVYGHCAYRFDAAAELIRSAGFDQTVYYEGRQPRVLPL